MEFPSLITLFLRDFGFRYTNVLAVTFFHSQSQDQHRVRGAF